ncbi:MAG: hypothetical protein WHV44_03815 [Anaerolineales bacterium]
MCTSFVYRKDIVLVGMNFDNDGKEYQISDIDGKGFLIAVKIGDVFFSSIGISPNGIFVNDQMVDPNENGVYKRQSAKRWVTSKLIDTILKTSLGFSEIISILEQVKIVNAPNLSTHNLIVDRNGDICIVEPGRKNIISRKEESDWFILTNFPISDYKGIAPTNVMGSGSDRYMKGLRLLKQQDKQMGIQSGFSILRELQQDNSTWITELSLIYDVANRELYYCQQRNFEDVKKLSLKLNK